MLRAELFFSLPPPSSILESFPSSICPLEALEADWHADADAPAPDVPDALRTQGFLQREAPVQAGAVVFEVGSLLLAARLLLVSGGYASRKWPAPAGSEEDDEGGRGALLSSCL